LSATPSQAGSFGGTVEAQTVQGEGSEFTIRMPLANPPVESRAAGAPEGDAHPGRPLRVLVVDDNVDTAESLDMLLRALNHEVRTAHDGPAAIRLSADFRPEAIFLDIGLPDMDGYEVAKRLRRDPKLSECTLVALTGYGQESDRERSREAGFDHHLTKPASFSDLEQILHDVDGSGVR
jgi:CheY-like chemotaxis protein